MKNKSKRLRKPVSNILIILSLIGILSSAFMIYSASSDYRLGDEIYKQLRISREVDISNLETAPLSIDFQFLRTQNPDLVGWIGTDGEEINYPLVRGKDNEFYLNHLFTREKNKLGSIFMDYRNQADFLDRNTIIYGHNMKDGSMFSSLINYKNEAYYQVHPTLPIFTPNGNYQIEFFAGFVVDGSYESIRFDFQDDADFMEYVESLQDLSTFESQLELSPEDRIVTLVTCSYEYSNARFALYGRIQQLP